MRLSRPEIRRARVWVLLVLAVLSMHAAVLRSIDSAGGERPMMPAPVVQVRSIAAAALPDVRAEQPSAVPSANLPQAAAPVVAKMRPPATPAARPVPVLERVPEPSSVPRSDTSLIQVSTAATEPVRSSSPPPDENAVPVYPTVLPPPATLRYDLRRGALAGRGELRWRPAEAAYTLQLDGSVAGLTVLTQISQGAFDTAGLAPQRFTDQRARRAPQAANFQRNAGKVTFSGPSLELPLVAGVQDRLSWMLQLAAIAGAAPARWLPGEHLVLQVVGARGDASVWSFRSLGLEPLQIAGETLQTLHLLRESRGPHDTVVDVWLDPARHHLPVRAHLRNGSGDSDGDGFELRLRDLQLVP